LLYEAIERRVDGMLEAGWLHEVRALQQRGCTTDDQAMQAIGYRHLLAHLQDDTGLEETVRLIKRDTRRFAKRQLTWFSGHARRNQAPDDVATPLAFQWLEWATDEEFEEAVRHITQAAHSL
jgi:tRNA A37 N6-isopentenylltransferase MiaA